MTKAATQAKGIDLNWAHYLPEPVPTDQNLTHAPVIAYWLQQDNKSSAFYHAEWSNQWGTEEAFETTAASLRSDFEFRADEDGLNTLRSRLQPHAGLLAGIREACRSRPYSRLDGDYSGDPFQWPMPPYGFVRNLSALLSAEALLALRDGDATLALQNAAAIRRLGNLNPDYYFLLNAMVESAVRKNYITPIYIEGLKLGVFTDAQLHSLMNENLAYDALGKLEHAFRYEISAQAKVLDQHFDASSDPILSHGDGDGLVSTAVQKLLPRGWQKIMLSRLVDYSSDSITSFDVPRRRFDMDQAHEIRKKQDILVKENGFFNSLAAMSLLAFRKIEDYTIKQHLLTDMTGIACALELYRRRENRYPDSLEALTPEVADKLHHDPVTEAPYHYKRITADAYALWSSALLQTNDVEPSTGIEDAPPGTIWPLSERFLTGTPINLTAPKDVDSATTDNEAHNSTPDETISIDFPSEKIEIILRNVAELFDLNVVIPVTLPASKEISIQGHDLTWKQVFDSILEPEGFTWYSDGPIIRVIAVEESARAPQHDEGPHKGPDAAATY